MDWSLSFRPRLLPLIVLSALFLITALIPNVSTAQTLRPYLLVASNDDPGRILRYDGVTGTFVDAFVPTASGGLRFTVGMTIAVGGDGNLYITNDSGFGAGGVWRYNGITGAFIDSFVQLGSGGLTSPRHLTFGPDGNLYVTDFALNAVLRYNGTTGAFMGIFASTGLNRPEDLLFGRDGNLYVSDDTHIVRYNGATGAFMDNFVPLGRGGIFAVRQIAIGPDNNLYAASAVGGVYRYNGTTGAFMDVFVPVGSGGQTSIWGIEFGADNNLYVTPAFGNNVLRFNGTTGAFMGAFVAAGSGGLSRSTDLLFFNVPNRSPVASNETYTTNEDTALNPTALTGVLANDTDADNDPLTAHLVTNVSNGTLTLAADGSFTYVPFANFNGSDSFTYYANDGRNNSNTATVTLNISPVIDAPTANNDTASTTQGTAVVIFILSNDSAIDGTLNPATVTIVGNPANGTASVNTANGAVTYTPNPAFVGPTDTFTYTVSDGVATSNIATVTIMITSVPNIPPTANNDTAITSQNTAVSIPVLANDVDPDGTLNPSSVVVTSLPANGTVTVNLISGAVTYTPFAGVTGVDSFTYTVLDDKRALSSTATVSVTVSSVITPPAVTTTITAETQLFTVPLCSDFGGQTNPIVRAQLPTGVYGVHCRIIAENHIFTNSSAEVGNQSVLNLNVIHAVDVFSPSGANAAGTQICLPGSGGLIFLDAKNAPRVPEWLTSTLQNNFTCGIIPNVGIVVLVEANVPTSVVSAQPSEIPTTLSLTDCRVTITHMVRLREEPNTTSAVVTQLPYNLVLQVTAKQDNWYQVIYLNGQGWVSGDYLKPEGNCG